MDTEEDFACIEEFELLGSTGSSTCTSACCTKIESYEVKNNFKNRGKKKKGK